MIRIITIRIADRDSNIFRGPIGDPKPVDQKIQNRSLTFTKLYKETIMKIEITQASIPGSDHTLPGKPAWKNNQDASFTKNVPGCTIGIVADGCGSGAQSEVGSNLGVRIFGEVLFRYIVESNEDKGIPAKMREDTLERARMKILGNITVLAEALSGKIGDVVETYFLFSIVGFVILQEKTYVFACGDGSYIVNGQETKLGPFPGNEPPYPCYALLGRPERSLFSLVEFETAQISDIAVATDGVDYFPGSFYEGYHKMVAEERVFSNPDFLRRSLAIINKERVEEKMLIPGPLKDDTTIVIARNVK